MPSLRASGAPLRLNALCEDGSRASLEAKKCAVAPETMNSGADMALDSAAEERRQHCKQAGRIAQPEAKRDSQQQRKTRRAVLASKGQLWETQRQGPNRRRRPQTTLSP
ncbi:hypothetical protein TRVL_10369 [Trypanosoma vivax]|nr:hypothetical protein TRVL_10369 [Trypanosoma vivax]